MILLYQNRKMDKKINLCFIVTLISIFFHFRGRYCGILLRALQFDGTSPYSEFSSSECMQTGIKSFIKIIKKEQKNIVRNAGIAALLRPLRQSLGLQTRGVDIWWQGYGGCDLLIFSIFDFLKSQQYYNYNQTR